MARLFGKQGQEWQFQHEQVRSERDFRVSAEKKDKLYVLDGPVFNHYAFISSPTPLPSLLGEGGTQSFSLAISDDLKAAAGGSLTTESRLELKLQEPVQTERLRLRLNGELPHRRDTAESPGRRLQIPGDLSAELSAVEDGREQDRNLPQWQDRNRSRSAKPLRNASSDQAAASLSLTLLRETPSGKREGFS